MRRWRGVDAVPTDWGRSVVTIGVFDGVHRGHQSIIGAAASKASELGVRSVVITFDPHPAEVVRPGTHPAQLTTAERKAELIAELGVDALCVLPFTVELSRLAPAEFVYTVLVERLHAAAVVVGENFRFGHKAAGDVAALREFGQRFGFTASAAQLLTEGDSFGSTAYSSTYIRACVAAGDVAAASTALGRPHRVDGVVVRGDRRGHQLGFPTANLEPAPNAAIPADGVYAGRIVDLGGRRKAPSGLRVTSAISVGTNPTFAGTARTVEAFALDFDGDLYGTHLGVEFVERLRGQERFDRPDELVSAMDEDVRRTRKIIAEADKTEADPAN